MEPDQQSGSTAGRILVDHLHSSLKIGTRQAAYVTINIPANVMLMTPINYALYRTGKSYSYYGGHYKKSPVIIRPPRAGDYELVIDLGGRAGRLSHSVALVDV